MSIRGDSIPDAPKGFQSRVGGFFAAAIMATPASRARGRLPGANKWNVGALTKRLHTGQGRHSEVRGVANAHHGPTRQTAREITMFRATTMWPRARAPPVGGSPTPRHCDGR